MTRPNSAIVEGNGSLPCVHIMTGYNKESSTQQTGTGGWLLQFRLDYLTGGSVGWAALTSGGNSWKSSCCSETMGVTSGGLPGLLSSWWWAFSWSMCFLTVRPSFKVIMIDIGPVCCLAVPSIHFGPFPVLHTRSGSDIWKCLGLAWVSRFLFYHCWLSWTLLVTLEFKVWFRSSMHQLSQLKQRQLLHVELCDNRIGTVLFYLPQLLR